jgi:hypothetical protein
MKSIIAQIRDLAVAEVENNPRPPEESHLLEFFRESRPRVEFSEADLRETQRIVEEGHARYKAQQMQMQKPLLQTCGSYGDAEYPTVAEEKRLLGDALGKLPKKKRQRAFWGINYFMEALGLHAVEEEEARAWLDQVADRVVVLPPFGAEYENTGNYLPGGQRRWYFGGEFVSADDLWLDG